MDNRIYAFGGFFLICLVVLLYVLINLAPMIAAAGQ